MVRRLIRAQGIVQGVGFRPFVYHLAVTNALSGYVANSSCGVRVEIEGEEHQISAFLRDFRESAPPLSQIHTFSVVDIPVAGDGEFVIRHSESDEGEFVLVPPDIGTCGDCVRDFNDPSNRRYRYPFTNCTNCGPRYTIIQDIPYDRPATTMSEFEMCVDCRREYGNPGDRRFHAQPNACPVCGPHIELRGVAGEPLQAVRELLRAGHIIAIKGLGGFHLACNAEDDRAVRTLRERKRRVDKPFAVMAPNLAAVAQFCIVTDEEARLLEDCRRPIVVLDRREVSTISPAVAPGNNTLGVMLPYTPLHYLLVEGFTALVMTSGNISEEPIVTDNDDALQRLGALADHFLFHNRRIQTRVDDSVTRVFAGKPRIMRRSRGFAPQPLDLGRPVSEILAVGAELKSTFCLTKDRYAIVSQHIGDLENYETLTFFEETLEHMKRFFRVEPKTVAYDLHPQYLSTNLAMRMEGVEKIGVQHHHAHIAACMADAGLPNEPVIGIAFDGTGYGTDGQIWGGEVLVCDYADFERRDNIRYVPMAGGDAAVREPWRIALSWLRETFGAQVPDIPALANIAASKRTVVDRMISGGINTILTSSCGRLFDAVAALLGIRMETNFEGQAAIELEAIAAPGVDDCYDFEGLDFRPTIAAIVGDLRVGTPVPVISARFHNTVATVVVRAGAAIRSSDGLNVVCLSGGTFQNRYLAERCVRLLRQAGLVVAFHSRVPTNDGGLALGQAVIADARLRR
jgi:hydrogenase maturation protein HypF